MDLPTLAELRTFARYHLKRRVVTYPAKELELGIESLGFELDTFVEQVKGYADRLEVEVMAEPIYQGRAHPILKVSSARADGDRTLLVLSGVHGNEQAGILSVPAILDSFLARRQALLGVALVVLTPVNPVGAACCSRYNADGYDINRDFTRFDTEEARVVRAVFEETRPTFAVALHEGPQDATFMFTNREVSQSCARRLLSAMEGRGTVLAARDYFGRRLTPPGYAPVGRVGDAVHTLWAKTLGMMASGRWFADHGVPEITLESGWRLTDRAARIDAHVHLVDAVLDELASSARPR